ncbi:hypothetical protein VTN31DRAFT_2151 [Thermomyces dupontii]|uniref:uncharacterized protein n=1 Tax=Talaromyces thermophilus TaxID=28565 RepID=UPI0037430A0A
MLSHCRSICFGADGTCRVPLSLLRIFYSSSTRHILLTATLAQAFLDPPKSISQFYSPWRRVRGIRDL